MKKEKYSEERFMSILWDLYRNTTKGQKITRYSNFCREHNITNNLFPVLVENKILKKEKVRINVRGKFTHQFTWASIPPNMHMAKKLMDELIKKSKKDNARRKEKLMHKELIELPEIEVCEIIEKNSSTIVPVYEMKQATVDAGDFNKYDIKIPVSETPFISNPVTISTDPPKNENLRLSGMHKPKSQKSISIIWGLISIKW